MAATSIKFDERTIAQTIVFLRAFCRAKRRLPAAVAISEGTIYEAEAWRKAAIEYLTAKVEGRKIETADKGSASSSDEYAELAEE